MRPSLAFLVSLAVSSMGAACAHGRGEDDAFREERHPIDHFMSKATFRTKFFPRAAAADEAPWPVPGTSVELVELTCTVREAKGGRTAHCVPGYALDKAFAALLDEENPPLGKEAKERIGQCYAVRAKAWPKDAVATYEAALRADPNAYPAPIDDAFALVYVAHDRAPFVGSCKPEADGTCLYAATENPSEATVQLRMARKGKKAELPFEPTPRVLELTFEDGHAPQVVEASGMKIRDMDAEPQDPATIAWDPIVAWYRANEPRSANFRAVLALAGRLDEARAQMGNALSLDTDLTAGDPCARAKP
jgi:hypothetical protein